MDVWLTYRPRDFLLFSEETYWRLFELQNEAVWPMQLPVLALLMLSATAAIKRYRWAGTAVGLSFGFAWVFVARSFLTAWYEPINWAVGYVLPVFYAEAALLVLLCGRLSFAGGASIRRLFGFGLLLLALAYPVFGLIADRPLAQAEIAGIAPDPTAITTLGLLALARQNWRTRLLSIVPAVWLVLSALTLLTLDVGRGWLLLCVAILALAIAFFFPKRFADPSSPNGSDA